MLREANPDFKRVHSIPGISVATIRDSGNATGNYGGMVVVVTAEVSVGGFKFFKAFWKYRKARLKVVRHGEGGR